MPFVHAIAYYALIVRGACVADEKVDSFVALVELLEGVDPRWIGRCRSGGDRDCPGDGLRGVHNGRK